MARGDGGKMVFETDDDRLVFLKRLEETCRSCGWRVHAWVLMGTAAHGASWLSEPPGVRREA
jgi:hypothetical protein